MHKPLSICKVLEIFKSVKLKLCRFQTGSRNLAELNVFFLSSSGSLIEKCGIYNWIMETKILGNLTTHGGKEASKSVWGQVKKEHMNSPMNGQKSKRLGRGT